MFTLLISYRYIIQLKKGIFLVSCSIHSRLKPIVNIEVYFGKGNKIYC